MRKQLVALGLLIGWLFVDLSEITVQSDCSATVCAG